jgi:type VI secretion system secreted protein VgrG
MKRQFSALLILVVCTFAIMLASTASADTLNTADSFAVLAGSTVTNTGPSLITGDLGVYPGTAITGFPPGTVTGGTIYSGGAVPMTAQGDVTSAFNTLAKLGAAGTAVPGGVLNGFNGGCGTGCYSPGNYFAPSTSLTGTITLSDGGVAGSVFIFYTGAGSALTTASNSVVNVSGLNPGDGVYWVVGSSATIGTGTSFEGNILALASITMTTGATDNCGRLLAQTAAVTLDTNTVSTGCVDTFISSTGAPISGGGGLNGTTTGGGPGPVATPEPGTLGLVLGGFCSLCFFARGRNQTARPTDFC